MSGQPSYQPPPNGWRTFLIVWGTQSVSVFGSALTIFTMNIWLTQTLYPLPEQKPQLAAALAALNLAFALADRLRRAARRAPGPIGTTASAR